MGYFVQHQNLILDKKTFPDPKQMIRGDVYELRYKSKTSTKDRYIVLALNVYAKTSGGKLKYLLHCLDLDEIPVIHMKKLLSRSEGVERRLDAGLEHQRMLITGRNTAYYDKEVKQLQKQLPGIYKTFSISDISRVELCNYNFTKVMDTNLKKKFGLLEDEN
jgi:hypothetical protein|tara:strand:+ start:214 stop:699 length:486 start_codon:yes stop_codon:yes gene_type:complete